MTRGPRTLYIDKELVDELRDLITPKKLSTELDELIKARVLELRGNVTPEDHIDYEASKKEHAKLVRQVEKLTSFLKGRDIYEPLETQAYASGLQWDGRLMNNLEKATKGILTGWKGVAEDAHTFISLLEAVKRKSEIERQLEKVRLE